MKSFTCKKPFWVNFRKYLLQYPPQLNCRNKERPGCKIGGNNFLSSNKIRIGRGTRRRYDYYRRNHSTSRQRRIESDADLVAATTTEGGTIPHCSGDGAASIRKSGPENTNQCTQEVVNWHNLAAIPKFTP